MHKKKKRKKEIKWSKIEKSNCKRKKITQRLKTVALRALSGDGIVELTNTDTNRHYKIFV